MAAAAAAAVAAAAAATAVAAAAAAAAAAVAATAAVAMSPEESASYPPPYAIGSAPSRGGWSPAFMAKLCLIRFLNTTKHTQKKSQCCPRYFKVRRFHI